jgi:hypothetical protein
MGVCDGMLLLAATLATPTLRQCDCALADAASHTTATMSMFLAHHHCTHPYVDECYLLRSIHKLHAY